MRPAVQRLLISAVLAIGLCCQSHAQGVPGRPADVLSRNVRALAKNPSDIPLLLATGRAALQVGDARAAAGFFGRARELSPASAAAHSGMGSALVGLNQPAAAVAEFVQAEKLGAPIAGMAADLGLAYDLMGDQAKAQHIYRNALASASDPLIRERLALSLAIGGDRAAALESLQPLVAGQERSALRDRAFILALGGDIPGSIVALEQVAQGSVAAEPFLRQLVELSPGEKAAAFNLGIFPDRFAGLGGGIEDRRPDLASDAASGVAAAPMEYGGRSKDAPTVTVDRQAKAPLALYGVFAVP